MYSGGFYKGAHASEAGVRKIVIGGKDHVFDSCGKPNEELLDGAVRAIMRHWEGSVFVEVDGATIFKSYADISFKGMREIFAIRKDEDIEDSGGNVIHLLVNSGVLTVVTESLLTPSVAKIVEEIEQITCIWQMGCSKHPQPWCDECKNDRCECDYRKDNPGSRPQKA